MEEAVFELARSGDGYGAIERSSSVVRKFKRTAQIRPAFLFLLRLSNVLIDTDQLKPSGVAAHRAITLFSDSPEGLPNELKPLVREYVARLTPGCFSPDLFSFLAIAARLVGDPDHQLRSTHARLADEADSYHFAQLAYMQLIFAKIKTEANISDELKRLNNLLWRWIATIPDAMAATFTSQFIAVRPIVILLAKRDDFRRQRERAALAFYREVTRNTRIQGLPLLLFAKLIIKAVVRDDAEAFREVVTAYKPLVAKDAEVRKCVVRIEATYFRKGQPSMDRIRDLSQLGSLVNGLLESLTTAGI
jgi:hypothetical protein